MSDVQVGHPAHAPHPPVVARIRQSIVSCSEALDANDFKRSDAAIADLTGILDGVTVGSEEDAEAALLEIRQFLCSPHSNQMAVDAVALAVPMAVTKLADVSQSCLKVGESVMECIASVCSPRDLLPILCEALDSLDEETVSASHIAFLLGGLKNAISCIKRHPVQQLKILLPVVNKALHAAIIDSSSDKKEAIAKMFIEASEIASSLQQVCENLHVVETKQILRAIISLYLLQVMALLTRSNLAHEMSHCLPTVAKLSSFFAFCRLTYMGLVTGSDVEDMVDSVLKEDTYDLMECWSLANDGAGLAVIWCSISGENVASFGDIATLVNELKSCQEKRWQAIITLQYILSSSKYPWWIKSHTIDLLLSITDAQTCGESNDQHADGSPNMLIEFFQAIEKTIIYAPDSNMRKKSFSALKNVLFDLPLSRQYEILKFLIIDNSSPSMIAILVDITKQIFFNEFCQRVEQNSEDKDKRLFWGSLALDVVEFILKPIMGGPPSLPEHTEPVLSALNLYRFILLTESKGKTNYSNALSEKSLRKAYNEWLLPLKSLVSRIEAENKDDSSEIAEVTLCSLNPTQLVLHRCIELVEEFLMRSK